MDTRRAQRCRKDRAKILFTIALTCIFMSVPYIAKSTPLSQSQFDVLLGQCASSSDPIVLRSVAHVESHFEPLVLHNDTQHVSLAVPSLRAGAEQAKQWISKGYSVDIGLMQINSSNLPALGMTIDDALDPCRSLEAGARLLAKAYAHGATVAERQAALLIALSRYNTGSTLAGLANGYAGQVLLAQGGITKSISDSVDAGASRHADWDIDFVMPP